MQKVDTTQATTEISSWLKSALNGEEIIITQNNQPILKLSQFSPGTKKGNGAAPKVKFGYLQILMIP